VSVLGHGDEVLDTDADGARDVDARLDGDDHPGLQRDLALLGQPRTLVDLDAHAVAEPVAEVLGVAGAVDDLARDRAIYDTVLAAQEAALAAVRPGVTGREADAVAREIIDAAGHAEHFGHGLGHGVGLVTHEAPRLARTSETPLQAGHVVTVEPGVYLPGVGGVRIEDLVVVTEHGRDVLSSTSKELLTVD